MKRFNFNSGPSALPADVLKQSAEGILELDHQGVSVAEISHRSQLFTALLEELISLIRELLQLTETHEVVVLQGGARLQFAQIPMNFLSPEQTAGFIDTGYWAHKAMEYAAFYGNTCLLASSADKMYQYIPKAISADTHLKYIQLTSNNTIYGTQYRSLPVFESPCIVDMSSDLMSMERNFETVDMAFACAQKNIGPSGLSVAIIKRSFLSTAAKQLPPVFSYQNLIAKKSNYATPPVVNVFMALLNMRWLKAQGGVAAMEKINLQKSALLYQEIERNRLFECRVNDMDRSMMNVCFYAQDETIGSRFLEFCRERNIIGMKGHKEAGGLRASLYNAVTLQDVQYLISVMQEFEHNEEP